MSWAALALVSVLVPGALDVRLDEARGMSDEECAVLIARVREAASKHSDARGTVVIRALAFPGMVRVTLSLGGVTPARVAHADLSGEPARWSAALDGALASLGLVVASPPPPVPPRAAEARAGHAPAEPPAVVEPAPLAPPPPDDGPSIAGISLLGGAAVAGAAGIVLGVMNTSARDQGNPLPAGPERDRLDDRATATGLGANVLFGVAGAALIAGIVVLISD